MTVYRSIRRRGYTIAYCVTGNGSPLVLIPGFLMCAQWFVEAGYVGLLRKQHRLILVDPLGFGRSDRPHQAGAYGSRALAGDLAAILDAEEVDRAAVWGFSRGGCLAADFAELHSGRCGSLIVGGTVIGVSGSDLLPLNERRRAALATADWSTAWSTLESVFHSSQRCRIERDNDPVAAAAASEGCHDRQRDLGSIRCPTVLYASDQDWTYPLTALDAEALGAQFILVRGPTHAELFQDARGIVKLLGPFLRSTRAAFPSR